MNNYIIDTYDPYLTITDILHDIYLGDIDENDIVDFLVYLEIKDYNSWLMFDEFLKIIKSLNKYGINSSDFTNLTNIGFKNQQELVYFDMGFGDYYAKTDRFNLDKFDFKNEKEIFDELNITNWEFIGYGANGEAFDIGNNKVLKITKDNSEAYNSCLILESNEKPENLINIHYVGEILVEGIQQLYVIIQDKVNLDSKIHKKYDIINEWFSNFKLENNIYSSNPLL